MKTYTIHTLFKGEESFLQMSRTVKDLQTSRVKIGRWVAEMGVSIAVKETILIIKEDGVPTLQAIMNAPRLSWRPYVPPKENTENAQENGGLA
jgi:hypothetical protein